MNIKHGLLVALVALVAWPTVSTATATDAPVAHVTLASCDDHDNQAEAQRAKDTRDADGDGIYCEDLPCPCLPPDPRAGGGGGDDEPAEEEDDVASCTTPQGVQRLVFDKDKYPGIHRHFRIALRKGWPRRLVINRPGADARRDRLLEDIPTRDDFDRRVSPPPSGEARARASSAAATRAAGRRTSVTCPARRTARTAQRSATSSRTCATARDSDTSSAEQLLPADLRVRR